MAGIGRCLIFAGLGVPVAIVGLRVETVLIDTRWTQSSLYYGVAIGLLVGAGLGLVLLGNQRVREPALAVFAAAAWVALANIGEPRWVVRLIMIGVILTVAATLQCLFWTIRATTDLWRACAMAVGSIAFGIALGAAVGSYAPSRDWAEVTAGAGVVTMLGVVLLLVAHQHRSADAEIPRDPLRQTATVRGFEVAPVATMLAGLSALCSVGVAPLVLAALRERFGVGQRYGLLLAVGAAALSLALGGVGHWWHRLRSANTHRQVQSLAVLTMVGAVATVTACVSRTLIGTIAAACTAIACCGVSAVIASVVSGAGAVASERAGAVASIWVRLFSATAIGVALSAWVLGRNGASTDISPRVVTAISALPALALGWQVHRAMRGAAMDRWTSMAQAPRQSFTGLGVSGPTQPGPSAQGPARDGRARSSGARHFGLPMLEVRGVTSAYGGVQALFGVDIRVQPGEIVALIGTNGAGKTTLLRSIAGLQPIIDGSISFGGVEIRGFDAADRAALGLCHIGPGAAISEGLTVGENLRMFAHGISRSEQQAATARAIEIFGRLGERLSQSASLLSGGEKQMLALAKAFVSDARLVIIDEFSLGLAPIVVAQLLPAIEQLRDRGVSVLMVEQSVNIAVGVADHVVCMEKGEIVFAAQADVLRNDAHLLKDVYLRGVGAAMAIRGDA